jgi:hypothetical protein
MGESWAECWEGFWMIKVLEVKMLFSEIRN